MSTGCKVTGRQQNPYANWPVRRPGFNYQTRKTSRPAVLQHFGLTVLEIQVHPKKCSKDFETTDGSEL